MMNMGLDYQCEVYRDVATGNRTEGGNLIVRNEFQGRVPCSFPEERSRQVEDTGQIIDIDTLVLRVGLNANVKIGDILRNMVNALGEVVFDDMVVIVPNLKRTHTEVRARRVR